MSKPCSAIILGASGSVGKQAISVLKFHGIYLEGISIGKNIEYAQSVIRELSPKFCVVNDEESAKELKNLVADTNTKILVGNDGTAEMLAKSESKIVVNAIGGIAGLIPTVECIKNKKDIALANKETLVAAGDIIMPMAKENGVRLLPVDSEHSAIYQCLKGNEHKSISRLILTCSGGAFLGKTKEELQNVTFAGALAHPTWKMGTKITVDCATLMNKGLEVIEAMHLFNIPVDKIEVVIHPESIIHSMVEYNDRAVIAQLSSPDMRLCIQYALFDSQRVESEIKPLNFYEISKLTFKKPDVETFSSLSLAYYAAKCGGIIPAVMNAANEKAVELFSQGKISFLEIAQIVGNITKSAENISAPTLDDIIKADKLARERVEEIYIRR